MSRLHRGLQVPLVVLLMVTVFAFDLASGREISVSIFYLIPVALTTWFFSRTAGILASLTAALAWLLGEHLTGATYSNQVIPWWNMLVRFGFFTFVTLALSARRRIEAELVYARADAQAASRAKSDFVNRVTHELRTPLTAILGFADLLQKRSGPYLTPADQECVRRIRANSESLLALVDGVLDVGRADARRTAAARVSVDVGGLVEAVLTDLRSRASLTDVDVSFEAPDRLAQIETDPALLRQVVLNLVSNAMKFTESGSIRIQVVADQNGEPVRILVKDTGMGISPEKIARIFEPFEQADGSIHRRFGGAGLGLTIAKDLCEVMGHRLEVESTDGVGSTFSVVLAKK
jgi:signal transduction histidine kinase